MKHQYIIKDWANITMNFGTFDTFEDASDALMEIVNEQTAKELQKGDTEYRHYSFDDLFGINLDEYQIIELELTE